MKTIAITGATGFTGGAIAKHFAAKGWRVLAFGRRDSLDIVGDVVYRKWDIATGAITIDEPADVVVHSAAKVDDFGAYADFYRVNVLGTQHVMDTFQQAHQFIYISTSSVYDPFGDKCNLREDAPYGTHYLNAYGKTKMLAEKVIIQAGRPNSVILRPRAIYGVGDKTLLPRIMNARRGRYLLGIGDGRNAMSLTYIGNLVHAVDLVTQQEFACEIFNITDGETVTLHTLYEAIIAIMGWQARPLFIPTSFAQRIAQLSEAIYQHLPLSGSPQLTRYGVMQLSTDYTLNIGKAQQELGYQPRYTYSEGLAIVRDWLSAQHAVSPPNEVRGS
ncbi:MAG: NAD-dependent epimerase/dehydratase family protein [Chloroflexota bacterium]